MDKKPTMTLVAFLLAAIAMTAAIFALTCCKSQDVTEAGTTQVTPIEMASGCPLDAVAYDTIEADEKAAQDVSPTIEHANGCPLDAVVYDAPKFTSSWNNVYKVTDRFSGQSWWLVRMDGKWVVLPITDTEVTNAR